MKDKNQTPEKIRDREIISSEFSSELLQGEFHRDSEINFLSPEESAQILSRVEENLLQYYRENFVYKNEKNREEVESSSLNWVSIFSWGFGFAAAALFLFFFFRPQNLPKVQYYGDLQIVEREKERRSEAVKISVPTGKVAKLVEPQIWVIESRGGRFSLKRTVEKTYHLSLSRGAVTVDIEKKKIREFSVSHREFQVVVKGTIFTVTGGDSWTNVEVWRGKVALLYKKKHLRTLSKGHGIFFENGKLSQTYRLPPPEYSKYPRRLRWMIENQPHLVHRYVLRLTRTGAYSQAQLKRWLRQLAMWERKTGRLTEVMETLKELSSLGGEGRDLALYDALKLCRQLFPSSMNCFNLYDKFLRNYPNSYWKKYVKFYLGEALLTSGRDEERGVALVEKYLENYPRDIYSKRALELLVRYWKSKGKSCSEIEGRLRLTPTLKGAFRVLCRAE